MAGPSAGRGNWYAHREAFRQIEVVIGEEISTTDGHMLGLFLREPVPPHLSPAETVHAIHAQGGLAIAAHPFTHLLWFGDLKGIGRQIAELPLDGVEVLNSVPTELYANWITAAYNARTRRHTPVGGSDCHYLPMLGRTYTRFAGSSAADLQTAIREKTARPGGAVNGPITVARFVRDQLRRRQLSLALTNDHRYRQRAPGLTIEIEERRDAPTAVLHCSGQLTHANADRFKAAVTRLLEGQITRLVVDLAQVSFLDSAGIGGLVAAMKRARAAGGDLALCALPQPVAMTLRLVHLDKALGIFPTEAAALGALATLAAQPSTDPAMHIPGVSR
ncbi:MAG: anti-sigma factor antagonist [Chloroflexales bacterium]|nr:anti-sigma factor antagonist [Chloroflexales bacterium]